MIEMRDASFYYDAESPVLEHITAQIEHGEFAVLLGGSGCGKSTLLSLLAGLNPLKSGSIEIDGQRVAGPAGKMGIMFQSDSLFPWMTVEGNIKFGIRQAFPGMKKARIKERAGEYLKLVGLDGHAAKYPAQLSGGMRQRAALARLMAMDKEILLLDEPFASLDPKMRMELSGLLEKLWRAESGKKTIVFVTHDVDEAILLADRILFMGDKNIEAEIRIPFQRPRGVDTIFNEEEYCIIRKQVIDLYYRHGEKAEGGKQDEDEYENSGASSGDSAPCTCCGSGRM